MITPSRLLAAGVLALAAFAAPVVAHAQSKGSADPNASQALQGVSPDNQTVETTWDNLIWFRTQPLSHDPFVNQTNKNAGANVEKQMFHYEHSDTGGLVWNSLTITGLFADENEVTGGGGYCPVTTNPVLGCTFPYPTQGRNGARELYMTYRGDIPMSTFGLPRLYWPGVLGTLLEVGGDANYKDDAYESRRKFLLVGPIFYLDLPGSVTFAIHGAQEWNHDFVTGHDTRYHPTWNTELSFTEYFDSDQMWRWEGVWNMTGSKGWDTTLSKTTTEIYTYSQIVLDWGPLVNRPAHKLDAFVGVQFWYDKFGYPAWGHPYGVPGLGAGGGAVELTPYIGLGFHF
jgi:hypothetical protein